jgi:hypothetical protein
MWPDSNLRLLALPRLPTNATKWDWHMQHCSTPKTESLSGLRDAHSAGVVAELPPRSNPNLLADIKLILHIETALVEGLNLKEP